MASGKISVDVPNSGYVQFTVSNDTWRKCAQELYALIDKDKITQNAMLVRIDIATGNKSYYRPVFVNASSITCSLMWLSTPNRLLSDTVELSSTGYRFSGDGTTITDGSTGTASITLRFYY